MDPQAGKKKEMKKQFMHKVKETFVSLVAPRIAATFDDVTVSEIICGDPECAPVDTIVRIIFKDAPIKSFGMPKEVEDVTLEDLQEFMPTDDVLEGWSRGEDLEWPPLPDEGEPPQDVVLRFELGDRVECRVGATKWAAGVVIKQWYREPGWPTDHFAPYQIQLDNGKKIFAPKDDVQVIRAEPPPPEANGADSAEPAAEGDGGAHAPMHSS
ncbi:hypothetical protein KFE25_004966 [Diacronema lutheri]|uniref:Uncharacterized protein n=2 Tax=Diacronema lutheri TaxID=2081491 RepID=A0A8J5XHX4_DIALT|nr:hypothetical protein KFE25_004966 [Diacronema lutheri]